MFPMREVVFKYKIWTFIIFLPLVQLYEYKYEPDTRAHISSVTFREPVLEGERFEHYFLYSCNSTEPTLKYKKDDPSHKSRNPVSSSNKNVSIRNNSEYCSLHLEIDPVSRNDSGWYFLMTNDGMGENIWLTVDYPPGKASCQLSSVYIEGEWIRLLCEAQAGSKPGQIVCYHNVMRLPPLSPPQENAGSINQAILSRLSDEVYCCSSFFWPTMDICACKDWGWNFTDNRPLTSIHPCAYASTTQSPPTPVSNFTTTLTQPPLIQRANLKWPLIIACIFMTIFLVTTITFGVCACKYKQEAQEVRISL